MQQKWNCVKTAYNSSTIFTHHLLLPLLLPWVQTDPVLIWASLCLDRTGLGTFFGSASDRAMYINTRYARSLRVVSFVYTGARCSICLYCRFYAILRETSQACIVRQLHYQCCLLKWEYLNYFPDYKKCPCNVFLWSITVMSLSIIRRLQRTSFLSVSHHITNQ